MKGDGGAKLARRVAARGELNGRPGSSAVAATGANTAKGANAPKGQTEPKGETEQKGLNERAIVASAIEIVAEVGVEGLSMRLLSVRLGVALGATYKYVPNKHTLLQLVARELYSRIEPPDRTADKFEQAKWVMLQVHDVLAAHPGMAAYIGQHIPDFESVSLVSMITEPLCAAGLSPTEADRITMALVFLIGGHLLVDMPADSSEDAASAFEDGVDLILGGARARVEGRCQRR